MRLGRALAVLAGGLALVVLLGVGLAGLAQWLWGARAPVFGQRCVAEVSTEEGLLRADLAPDQTANAALITGIAQQRGLPARAATIALATAIQESGLRNIDYGDRDSLGLFQQRPSQGWGTEEQVQDPVYATDAFYDALVRIDGYEGLEVTDAAQRVQRSAFPDAYADHEDEGRALASTLYGMSPAGLSCRLDALSADEAGSPDLAQLRAAVLAELERWGPPGAAETANEDPSLLLLDTSGSTDPARTSWAVAQSLVAWADRLQVGSVQVGDQVWLRSEPDAGWQAVEDATHGAAEADVVVRLGG